MSAYDPNRRPAEIEGDIERTRAAMSETLEALQRKLSPGQIVDQVLGYFKSGPGEFAHNLGDTIKNNPVPTALIGIGLSWMMVQGPRARLAATERRHDDGRYGDGEGRGYGYGADEGRGYGYGAGEAPGLHEAPSTAQGYTYRAGELSPGSEQGDIPGAGRSARERVSGAADDIARRMSGAAGEARERAGEMAHDASERLHHAAEGVRHAAAGARERGAHAFGAVRERGERARGALAEMMHERPLVLGAVSLAVGAILGAMLPATRREDELLGEPRDRLLRRAAEVGREQWQAAREVASKTVESAKEEADRQGLSDAGGRLAEQAATEARKTAAVASAAVETAGREAERQHLGGAGKDAKRAPDESSRPESRPAGPQPSEPGPTTKPGGPPGGRLP